MHAITSNVLTIICVCIANYTYSPIQVGSDPVHSPGLDSEPTQVLSLFPDSP